MPTVCAGLPGCHHVKAQQYLKAPDNGLSQFNFERQVGPLRLKVLLLGGSCKESGGPPFECLPVARPPVNPASIDASEQGR